MLLHVATDDFLRGILIFDTRNKVHVYPESATAIAASLAKNTYIFIADQKTGILSGYSLSYSTAYVCISLDTSYLPNILYQLLIMTISFRNLFLIKYGNYIFRPQIKE